MISVKADFTLGVILVGLLSTLTSCAGHSQIRSNAQTTQSGEVKSSTTRNATSTTNGTTSKEELVPMRMPAATEPKEQAPTAEPSATTVRPSGNADDPRAVIDWLLDSSRRGR